MTDFILQSEALNFIGLFGVFLYLGSYTALQIGVLKGQGYLYPAINFAAASCVLASLAQNFNLSSAMIQIAWIVISLIGIIRIYIVNSRLRFSEEERMFMGEVLEGLEPSRARLLLNQGLWADAEPGAVFTTEGKPVDQLIYVAAGRANVDVSGKTIAICEQGAMIGEVTYLSGEPASATVRAVTAMRCLCFEAVRLKQFLSRNPDIRAVFEQNMANHLRKKLVASNNKSD